MNFQQYQEQAVKSLRPETTTEMLALHLVEKVGVIAGIKYRALKSGAMNTDDLAVEIGWCLWCVAAIAHRKGFSPKTVDQWPEWKDATKRGQARTFLTLARVAETLSTEPQTGQGLANGKFCLEHCLRHVCAIAQCNGLTIEAIALANLARLEARSQ